MQVYIVHYGELGLKGRNRIRFERQLVQNIQTVLKTLGHVKVSRLHSYLVVKAAQDIPADMLEQRLSKIFGIAYFAPTIVTPQDMNAMSEAALSMIGGKITPAVTFKVDTTRGNKQFPLKSFEVSREIGAHIVEATHAPVKLKNPDVTLNIQIYDDVAYLFLQRITGAGGLPVGVSGRVLTLLSGGIDSPVAAYMLLKRGCTTDFLHFHLLPNKEMIHRAKIVDMAKTILAPHQAPTLLHMASAAPFETAMAEIETRVATVVFRRFVMRVAERIAQQSKALALVTGESVGQVASQTLKNINLIGQATTLPVFRPLIGMDKSEIIALAKHIDTYELSILPYKDPCSIHARRPATWAQLEKVLDVEQHIHVDALVEETIDRHIETIPIKFATS